MKMDTDKGKNTTIFIYSHFDTCRYFILNNYVLFNIKKFKEIMNINNHNGKYKNIIEERNNDYNNNNINLKNGNKDGIVLLIRTNTITHGLFRAHHRVFADPIEVDLIAFAN